MGCIPEHRVPARDIRLKGGVCRIRVMSTMSNQRAKPDPNAGRAAPWRPACCLLFFAASLFSTDAVLRPMLPFPRISHVAQKVEWLDLHGGAYDTLFLGTSRTHGGIQPDLFDTIMTEAGAPAHSFNLGINAMRPPEDTYVLESVLSKRRTAVKLVICECNPVFFYDSASAGNGTERLAYWHDAKRTMAMLLEMAEETRQGKGWLGRSWKSYARLATNATLQVSLFLTHCANFGRGSETLAIELGISSPAILGNDGDRTDGYEPHEPGRDAIDDADWKIFSQMREDRLRKPAALVATTREAQIQLRDKQRLIAASGARMVLFRPPILRDEFAPDPQLLPGVPIFNFANPARYPELFDRTSRFNMGHLNAAGAKIFTRLLATRVAAWRHGEDDGDGPGAP